MRLRLIAGVALAATVLAGCGSGDSNASGPQTRHVLVDYGLDEFPASYYGYYPRVVEAHPGDTIDFTQHWSGDPHTVTLGTLADKLIPEMAPILKGRTKPLPEFVDTEQYGLPSIFSHVTGDNSINQTEAQPCFVTTGPLPEDGGCSRVQPVFDGTQEFYNSGYIPYRGTKGNEFKVPLAKQTKPGEYFYYCLLHGPGMGGFIDVKPASEAVRTVPADLRDPDLRATNIALRAARARAQKKSARLAGTDIQAGAFTASVKNGQLHPASVNEFLPSTFHARVDQPVTWSFTEGPGHTVSFDVPSYLPVIQFKKNGSVQLNADAIGGRGGPGYPATNAEAPKDGFPVDVGRYDGSHFLSSGYNDGPMRYSITFTKPGTYPYACLLHPRMIGKVVVT